jgi:hypothetical protein
VAALRAIEAGSELAHVVAEKADSPNLTGPARALSRRAHNDVEAGLATPPAEGDVVWVSPADILARRIVSLPRPAQEALAKSSATVVAASSASASAATITLANHPSTVRASRPEPRQSTVVTHEMAGPPILATPHHRR